MSFEGKLCISYSVNPKTTIKITKQKPHIISQQKTQDKIMENDQRESEKRKKGTKNRWDKY